MAIELGRRPLPAMAVHPPLVRRLYGRGSIFGKTLRDSRWSILVVATVLGVIILSGGATMASTYGTHETRIELETMAETLPPALVGIYGDPIRVDTLGGFISWHYGAYFALLAGLWSILALSSTLALEAKRGSLEFAAVVPISRRKLALEKVTAHVVAVLVAVGLIGALTWLTGAGFAKLDGDSIPPEAAFAFALSLGLKALVAGSIAFAIAPILGRGAAAGLAGAVMLGGYVLNSYRTVVSAFDVPSNLTWFAWTRDQVPLAGQYDWSGVVLAAIVSVVFFVIGIEVFTRRDVGVTVAVPSPRMPRALLGTRGPVRRSFGELLPTAGWWGLGLGIYGFVMAVSGRAFIDELERSPGLLEAMKNMVPGVDLATTAGFLQFVFIDMGLALAGLAAATFVAGWASDETSGRLELLITTPLTRARWAIASGVAVWLATAVTVGIVAIGLALGVTPSGDDPIQPAIGMIAVALYAMAMAGVGIAVGGVVGPRFAAPTVVAVTIGTFLVQLLVPVLRWPDWVQQLALSDHVGHPLVGSWDPAGLAACVVLAVGGVAVGALGVRHRDVG